MRMGCEWTNPPEKNAGHRHDEGRARDQSDVGPPPSSLAFRGLHALKRREPVFQALLLLSFRGKFVAIGCFELAPLLTLVLNCVMKPTFCPCLGLKQGCGGCRSLFLKLTAKSQYLRTRLAVLSHELAFHRLLQPLRTIGDVAKTPE